MGGAGIDRIGLDGTLYDQVLDFIFYLGLAPERFQVHLPLFWLIANPLKGTSVNVKPPCMTETYPPTHSSCGSHLSFPKHKFLLCIPRMSGKTSEYHPAVLAAIAVVSDSKDFGAVQHLSGYEQYFAMARGVEGTVALDMSKFFDTNYHYMVPELDSSSKPTADWSKLIEKVCSLCRLRCAS